MDMITIVLHVVSITVLVLASLFDIRTREVPDFISYSYIAAAFAVRVFASVLFLDMMYIYEGLLGFGLGYVLAIALYYAGQWGGGDAKILMGVGTALGIPLVWVIPHFALFFVLMLLFGAIFGMGYTAYLFFKHYMRCKEFIVKTFSGLKYYYAVLWVVCVGAIPVAYFFSEVMLSVTVVFAVMLLLIAHLWLVIKSVETCALVKEVFPEVLTEGDWIAEDVKVNGKVEYSSKSLGIEKKDIRRLVDLAKKHKFTVKVKDGMAFLPSFLFGYIALVVVLGMGFV
jgi:Flp pilus assembly protein protease CpaA